MNTHKYTNWYMKSMILMIMPICLLSCLKNTDTPLAVSKPATIVSPVNLSEILAAGKAVLFWQAIKRTGLDVKLAAPGSSYTLLVPSDAAMQAAGLTQATISSFNLDSLSKLLRYHILPGAQNDSILDQASLVLKTATLVDIPPYPPVFNESVPKQPGYPLPIFIKHYPGHGLYVNGQFLGKEAPVAALNGYLYPIDKLVLAPFGRSIYDFLQSQPDLSLYVAALKIVDDINGENYNTSYDVPGDTVIFRKQGVFTSNRVAFSWQAPNCFTVFAPTNAAFEAAGFHTEDDIRNFAAIDHNTSLTYQSPMDSMLRRHVVFNKNNTHTLRSILLYADLQYNPASVNAAGMNTYIKSAYEGWDGGNYMKLRPLLFSADKDIPYIKWSSDPAKPLVPVPQEDPAAALPNHFFGHNGVVYKVNTLFFRD